MNTTPSMTHSSSTDTMPLPPSPSLDQVRPEPSVRSARKAYCDSSYRPRYLRCSCQPTEYKPDLVVVVEKPTENNGAARRTTVPGRKVGPAESQVHFGVHYTVSTYPLSPVEAVDPMLR